MKIGVDSWCHNFEIVLEFQIREVLDLGPSKESLFWPFDALCLAPSRAQLKIAATAMIRLIGYKLDDEST